MAELDIKKEIKFHLKIFQKNRVEREHYECEMLWSFIQLIKDDHLKLIVKELIDGESFDNEWYNFHKRIRQTDFYDDMMRYNEEESLSGYLDSLLWDFFHVSDMPYKFFKFYILDIVKNEEIDKYKILTHNDANTIKGTDNSR